MDKRFINIAGEVVETPDFKDVTWRPSAYALILDVTGRILAMRIAFNGQYNLPGGGTELHESLQECVERETYEETGYRVKVKDQPFYVREMLFRNEVTGECNHSIGFFFKARVVGEEEGGNILDKEGSVAVEWIDPKEAAEENWCHWSWPVVKKLIDGEVVV